MCWFAIGVQHTSLPLAIKGVLDAHLPRILPQLTFAHSCPVSPPQCVLDHSMRFHSRLPGNPFMMNPGTAPGPSEFVVCIRSLTVRCIENITLPENW